MTTEVDISHIGKSRRSENINIMAENTTHTIEIQTETDNFTLKGRPCEMSSFSFIPTVRNNPPERTAYNSEKTCDNLIHFDTDLRVDVTQIDTATDRYPHSTYERLFRKEYGFNNKLHRCDREHAKSRGLIVNEEEKRKDVPTLASSDYGHRLDMFVDHPDRKHVRIARVRSEFYRRNGITS